MGQQKCFVPHGLPLFFADPVDFTISTARVRPQWWSSGSGKYAIIRDVRPSNNMRSTAPFAVSAAPAEAGHDMNVGAAYTVRTYTEGSVPIDFLVSNGELRAEVEKLLKEVGDL